MFQKQEIRNLVGLKPQSLHVWLKKLLSAKMVLCNFTILWCHQERKSSLGWPSKTTKLVVPNLPSHF